MLEFPQASFLKANTTIIKTIFKIVTQVAHSCIPSAYFLLPRYEDSFHLYTEDNLDIFESDALHLIDRFLLFHEEIWFIITQIMRCSFLCERRIVFFFSYFFELLYLSIKRLLMCYGIIQCVFVCVDKDSP